MWNLLVRLLDIEELRDAEPGSVVLRWQTPWADWVILLTVLLSVLFVALTYDRERVRPRLRMALTGLRAAVVVVMVALLCRPVLVWQRTREEPSVAALVVDVSASMARRDRYADEREAAAARFAVERFAAGGTPTTSTAPSTQPVAQSRLELFRAALTGDEDRRAPLAACLDTNQLAVYAFGTSVRRVSVASSPDELNRALNELWDRQPGELTTDIAGALERVLTESRIGRLAGVVVASDGRATTPGDVRSLIDLAKRRRVPVFPILIGSTTPAVDVSLGPLLADENVFVKDVVAIKGTLSANLKEKTAVRLELFEEDRNQPLAAQTVTLGGENARGEFEFRIRPFRAGRHKYRVVAEAQPNETGLENNVSRIEVNAVEDKIRVLYVEAYPRFEYRYLKNALVREPTIVSSVLLLSADEGFAQEGTAPIRRFPENQEELFDYDVVILGDVNPRPSGPGHRVGWLTAHQAELLVKFVGQRGGGFILIAGQRSAPQSFRGTPLEKLLPVMIDPQYLGLPGDLSPRGDRVAPTHPRGFQLELTPEGRDSPVFRFESEPDRNLETIASFPPIYWYAPTLGPKPAATVLARHPTDHTVSGSMPLVVTGRYGAGRVYFHGTDDSWLWRRGTGEAFYDTYWLQAIRFCTENRLLARSRSVRLFADRRQYDYAQPVRITLRVAGEDLAAALPDELHGHYCSTDREHAGDFTLMRLGPKARNFEGRFTPPAQGTYVISADVPLPGTENGNPQVIIRVRPTNLELLAREADHQVLRQLAAQTGGKALYLDELDRLSGLLPDRRVRIPDDWVEPIWDTRLILGLMVLILSMEWALRKWFGLI